MFLTKTHKNNNESATSCSSYKMHKFQVLANFLVNCVKNIRIMQIHVEKKKRAYIELHIYTCC